MNIRDIIQKHYDKLYRKCVSHNKVISQGRTPEDLLNDVCFTAIRKFGDTDIIEEEGLIYLKKTLYNENIFQYKRIKNEIVIYTDAMPDVGYLHGFDN